MGKAHGRFGWRVHAWVLMGNHFHMLLEDSADLRGRGKWNDETELDNDRTAPARKLSARGKKDACIQSTSC